MNWNFQRKLKYQPNSLMRSSRRWQRSTIQRIRKRKGRHFTKRKKKTKRKIWAAPIKGLSSRNTKSPKQEGIRILERIKEENRGQGSYIISTKTAFACKFTLFIR